MKTLNLFKCIWHGTYLDINKTYVWLTVHETTFNIHSSMYVDINGMYNIVPAMYMLYSTCYVPAI